MTKNDLHSPEKWAEILQKQADLTREYRHSLYKKVDLKNKKTILDVGCGTGAVTADIASLTEGRITGIDIDDAKLTYAHPLISEQVSLLIGNVLHLPFADCTFDLVTFSVVLTHIHEQQQAVNEMARVTREGGVVLATMEPDYAGRFHYPENRADPVFRKEFEDIGAEMYTGRKLRYLFNKAGLKTEIGFCDITVRENNKDSEKAAEEFLEYFERREKALSKEGWTAQEIEEYKEEQLDLIKNNLFFSFCPCFYAIGRK